MGKHDSAPTHGWVISSQINKWLALLFMVIFIISFVSVYTIKYSLDRDCEDVYKRNVRLGNYWLHVQAGSVKEDCPASPEV